MFKVRFINDENSINWFQTTIYYDNFDNENSYFDIVVQDDTDTIYYAMLVHNNNWYNFQFDKIFNYKIKCLIFDGDTIKVLDEIKFDIKKHNFNIVLKSDNKEEIKIWKYYLWLVQIKLDVKFNIKVNEYFQFDNVNDFVEISRKSYEMYLKRSEKPLNNDFSSLTIITSLFDILDDNSDILNHPWLTT